MLSHEIHGYGVPALPANHQALHAVLQALHGQIEHGHHLGQLQMGLAPEIAGPGHGLLHRPYF